LIFIVCPTRIDAKEVNVIPNKATRYFYEQTGACSFYEQSTARQAVMDGPHVLYAKHCLLEIKLIEVLRPTVVKF